MSKRSRRKARQQVVPRDLPFVGIGRSGRSDLSEIETPDPAFPAWSRATLSNAETAALVVVVAFDGTVQCRGQVPRAAAAEALRQIADKWDPD